METVRVAIIYYSSTGTNYQMALAAQEAAEEAGAKVRLRKVRELAPDEAIDQNPAWRAHLVETQDVPEASLDDLQWADAYIFGSPTRYGSVPSQLKQFIDTTGGLWSEGQLANRVVAGFTSAQNPHGGQETTLLAMYNIFHHWGCIIVAPAYTSEEVFAAGGNPYGVSTEASPNDEIPDEVKQAIHHMVRRVIQVACWIAIGQEEEQRQSEAQNR